MRFKQSQFSKKKFFLKKHYEAVLFCVHRVGVGGVGDGDGDIVAHCHGHFQAHSHRIQSVPFATENKPGASIDENSIGRRHDCKTGAKWKKMEKKSSIRKPLVLLDPHPARKTSGPGQRLMKKGKKNLARQEIIWPKSITSVTSSEQ